MKCVIHDTFCGEILFMTKILFLTASNIDPQECPGNGIYAVNSAIGPPYISSRRKRNHNKCHHRHCDTEHKR